MVYGENNTSGMTSGDEMSSFLARAASYVSSSDLVFLTGDTQQKAIKSTTGIPTANKYTAHIHGFLLAYFIDLMRMLSVSCSLISFLTSEVNEETRLATSMSSVIKMLSKAMLSEIVHNSKATTSVI